MGWGVSGVFLAGSEGVFFLFFSNKGYIEWGWVQKDFF